MFYYRKNIPYNESITQEEHFFKFDFNYNCYDMFDNEFIQELQKLPIKGVVTVENGEVGRPDLLSFKVYETTRYHIYLMIYNEILNSDELILNKKIKYFSEDDFISLVGDFMTKSN